MPMYIIANNLSGNCHTMHPATGAYLIYISDRIMNSVMIEIEPVLKICSIAVAGVMNSLDEIAP